MKSFHTYVIVVLSLLVLSACEEVITLDLPTSTPRVVIEGTVTDQPGPYQVKISSSVNFYESNTFPPGEGATVTFSDEEGNSEVLTDMGEGIYQTSTLQGQRGVNYSIEVVYNGETYNTNSQMPGTLIPLDSLVTEFQEESLFYEEGYYLTAYWQDPPEVGDYYRLKVFVNGEPYYFENDDGDLIEDSNLYLLDDKYFNGNIIDYEFFSIKLALGDEVYVELNNLDEPTYQYYRTLAEVLVGTGVAPANPVSNFGTSAMGYFGAFSVTSNQIVVEE